MMGLSGAWIANIQLLEPFRPVFIGVALAALFLAQRRIWRPACTVGCAAPQVNLTYKSLFAVVSLLVLIALAFPYIAPWFY